jgi:oligopeptide/dipeptide ABC transporter ATP-binding protein
MSAAPHGSPDTDALVSVRELAVRFPARGRTFVHAVDGLDLDVRRRETLGLVGESGCGKSTAGRAILQLIRPSAGRVTFDGRELTSLWRRRWGRPRWSDELRQLRSRMQMIFQDPYASLDPRMTVEELVAEPLQIFGRGGAGEQRRQVQDLLAQVGMDPQSLRRYPHEFSGGQRQRIGIARALALKPEFIVCDEPISALDVSIRAQVLNLLMDLQREHALTYLLIAHDIAAVRHVSDRIAVMYLGRIVELGPAPELCAAPLHPYTRALVAAVPLPDPAAERERARRHLPLIGEPPSPIDPPAGCRFHPRCPVAVERCRAESPALRAFPGGRAAACHLA